MNWKIDVCPEEVVELQRRYEKQGKDQWEETTQGKLCLAFYKAFMEYKKFLEQHEYAKRNPHGETVDYDEHRLFAGLRIIKSHHASVKRLCGATWRKHNRQHAAGTAHMNGKQCGAPRVKGKKLCHVHERMEQVKTASLDLGPMEDPDSIQLGIRMLQGAIIEGKLDYRQVGQLAYTIQLAAWNVMRTSTVRREE